ncbi:MAG: lipoyl(octanoyl) transferase LipB [Rickettsiales bacterium]
MPHTAQIAINQKPVPYHLALAFMQTYVDEMEEGDNFVWLLEHLPVYTAGTSANENELLNAKHPVVHTNRGGKFTYHGPGQRVVYLMLNIKELHFGKPDIKKFVKQLEEWVLESLQEMGVECFTREGRVGVWAKEGDEEKKIVALGIRVRRWKSFHGIALNITTDAKEYDGIIPCGIKEFGVTSLHKLGKDLAIEVIDKILINKLSKKFNLEFNYVNEIEL